MSVDLQPLIWKNIDKTDSDDVWPKKIYSAALVFIKELNQYFLIGGNDLQLFLMHVQQQPDF